jgi:hypothetical protein
MAAAPASATPSTPPKIDVPSYPPRDDCKNLRGWSAFYAKLKRAIRRRDAATLVAVTDRNLKLDFGGGYGTRELKRRLTDKEFRLWEELDALLTLGCSGWSKGRRAVATLPWIAEKSPEFDDPYAAVLILGKDVPVYADDSAAAPVVGTLDWAFVMVDEYAGPDRPRSRIILPGGKGKVYVDNPRMRSVLDYQLEADLRRDGWHVNSIIAGD